MAAGDAVLSSAQIACPVSFATAGYVTTCAVSVSDAHGNPAGDSSTASLLDFQVQSTTSSTSAGTVEPSPGAGPGSFLAKIVPQTSGPADLVVVDSKVQCLSFGEVRPQIPLTSSLFFLAPFLI